MSVHPCPTGTSGLASGAESTRGSGAQPERRARAALVLLAAALLAPPLAAQDASRALFAAATLHVDPGKTELATLPAGTRVVPTGAKGDWAEVRVEGWVFSASLEKTTRDGFDLAVKQAENLRAEPNGKILARLRPGMLLDRVETKDKWTRVRRTGWVKRAALAAPDTPGTPLAVTGTRTTSEGARTPTVQGAPAGKPAPAKPAAPKPATPAAPPATGPDTAGTDSVAAPARDRVELGRAAALRGAPDGPALAQLQPGVGGRVVTQQGEWVKVQVEGWVREAELAAATSGVLRGVTAAEVRANPAKYIGQTVEWRVQFISMQVADELRPELPVGQPYLLVRGPLPEAGFVYVTATRDQLAPFRALGPLAEVTLRLVIRAGRTRYLATPVAELVEMSGAR